MADEVGKIFLSLELKDNTEKGMKTMAAGAEKQASAAFSSVGSAAANSIIKQMKSAGTAAAQAITSPVKAVAGTVDNLIKRTGAAATSLKRTYVSPAQSSGIGPAVPKATEPAFATSSNNVELLNQKLDVTYAKLGEQERKLRSLMAEYQKLSSLDVSNSVLDGIDKQITDTQSRMISLQGTINSTESKIKSASGSSAGEVSKGAKKGQSVVGKAAKAMGSSLSAAFKKGSAVAGSAMKNIQQKASGLSKSVKSAFKSAFLMAGLYAAFRGIRSLIGEAASQNAAFSNSLQAVKTNLSAAFVPIANTAMPYINMLMSGITNLSAKLASTTANLFGTTVAQSTAAAKKLKSTADAAKKSATATASIDQLNVIDQGTAAYTAISTGKAAAATGAQIEAMLISLASKVGSFFARMSTKISSAAPAFIGAGSSIIVALLTGINQSFPDISAAGKSILQTALDGLWQISPQVGPLATNIVSLLLSGFLIGVPQLFAMGMTFLSDFLSGFSSQIPSLIPMAQQAIWAIMNSINSNLPSILQSGITIIISLISGISQMAPSLIPKIIGIVFLICDLLIQNAPVLLSAAWELIVSLGQGILNSLPMLGQYLGQLVSMVVDKIVNTDWLEVGKKIVNGIFTGIKALIGGIGDFFSSFFNGLFGRKSSGSSASTVSVPKFASGGIVSGPTLAMVGEYGGARSNPEVITPLSKLKEMIGTGQTSVNDNTLSQILSLLQHIEQILSGSNLGELSSLLYAILRWLEDQDFDIRLIANDREIARSANRGNKVLSSVIAE